MGGYSLKALAACFRSSRRSQRNRIRLAQRALINASERPTATRVLPGAGGLHDQSGEVLRGETFNHLLDRMKLIHPEASVGLGAISYAFLRLVRWNMRYSRLSFA